MGRNYGNLFVGNFEHKFFSQYNGSKPDLYKRFLDDCIDDTSSSKQELTQFINSVNSFNRAPKYASEHFENCFSRHQTLHQKKKTLYKPATISLLIFSKTICTLNLGRVCQAKCSICSHIFIQFWGLSRAVKSARTMLGQNHVMIKMAGIEEYIDEEGD